MDNVEQILSGFKSDSDYLNGIYEQLFDVVKLQYPAPVWQDETGKIIEVPFDAPDDAFGIYKTTGGKPLGSVGKDYFPQQPRLIFEYFTEALIKNELPIDGIKFMTSKDFSKVRFRIPLKQIEFLNSAKLNDVTDVFLNIQTGFDGKTKTTLFLETLRLICNNGMKKSSTEQICKFKNTTNNYDRIYNLNDDIEKVVNKSNDIKFMYELLDNYQIDTEKYNDFFLRATGYDLTKKNEINKTSRNIMDSMQEAIEKELSESGNTLFSLFNGITRYTNHYARNCQRDNPDYIFYGKGLKTNDVAWSVANQMVREN